MEAVLSQFPVYLLGVARISGLMAASPIFSGRFLPIQLRVAITFLLAYLILPTIGPIAGPTEGVGLWVSCIMELGVGLVLGFSSLLVFTVAQMGGALLDMDMGFSMAHVLDPTTGIAQPIVGNFLQLVMLAVYFTVNGHHGLIRAVAGSYALVPAGGAHLPASLEAVVLLFSQFLGYAVQMVLPVMGTLMVTSVALAGLSKAVPQFNLFASGMPIKATLGLGTLMLVFPHLLQAMGTLYDRGLADMQRLLHLMQ